MSWVVILLLLSAATCISGQFNPNCAPGRHVIVHLFEWRWNDIADECERYLGPKGFCGVQISPPNEHRVIPEHNPDVEFNRYQEVTRPWYERYQPVSYKLDSRSGSEAELKEMITRCNNANVRIYVDTVINHMTGGGDTGRGSAGSRWDSSALNFTGVPYSQEHFHGGCAINNYGNKAEVRYCRLENLVDLDVSKQYVRQQIGYYMNNLIALGVAGFRIDASKHMYPADLRAIVSNLNNLNTTYFNASTKPFIYQEVIDLGGEAIKSSDYIGIGRITEFKYGKELARLFRDEVQLKELEHFGESWDMISSMKSVVFVDNHDNQRGHGGGGNIITFRDSRLYKMANAFMLAWSYGFPRIMSSYAWNRNMVDGKDKNDWVGPPAEGNSVQNTKPIVVKSDGSCDNGWICEHRWRQIGNMVPFRNLVAEESVENWWDNWANQIAFSRGNKGFIAINGDQFCLAAYLNTGLPEGIYCDVISGNVNGSFCTGRKVLVNSEGRALIDVPHWIEDPVMAIHVGARINSPSEAEVSNPPSDFQRTVVLIEKQTNFGQDLFLRGGIDHFRRAACQSNPSACAIPIRYRSVGTGDHYAKYRAWCVGDTTLDWGERESGQGTYNGTAPCGSPVVWTSNKANSAGYQSVNSYGDHYWLLDVDMDCSRTLNGWFELKAVVKNSNGNEVTWEENITHRVQNPRGKKLPFCSENHIAKCGKLNVLHFGSPNIEIKDL